MDFRSGWSGVPDLTKRFIVLSLVAAGIFLLLVFRLWYLQVVKGERYHNLSEKNRIRYLPIAAPRGPVYDRDGALLIDNRPGFGVSIMRQDVENREELLERLAGYLGVQVSALEERWKASRRLPGYRPLPMADDVDRDTLERVLENAVDLPGVLTEVRPIRSYPHGDMAAHLFGYMGEVTDRELEKLEAEGYRSGDFTGKSGLEQQFERFLRGTEGQRLVEVDVKGKELRQLKTQEALPGNKVYLTLRRDLQLAGERAFGDKAGSVVAIDVRTGEILAMVSRPTFEPSHFARGIAGEEWLSLLDDPRHPLQYKGINGQYPPGSTFKIVTALAALKAGVASPSTTVTCTGSIHLGNREFRCWKNEGHGRVDLRKALMESCDVWFYLVSLDLGIDRLSDMAVGLGLGEATGFPLAGEKRGLIPNRAWKRKQFKAPWYDGETIIAAIGQGYVLTTPLQLAVMTAAVANGGTVYQPQVIRRIEDWQGNPLLVQEPKVLRRTELPPAILKPVLAGLESTVNDSTGTGRASRLEKVRVAGKTGTAQVVRRKSNEEEKLQKEIPYRFRDHALFVAYAPADAPEIAVAVVVEHGGHGGAAAAPIARQIFASYFGLEPAVIRTDAVITGD